jgi:hypothetical protein
MMKPAPGDKELTQGAGDIEPVTGQPIEEAEKNLSRHATKDSSPPVEEQSRTSVGVHDTATSGGAQEQSGE